MIRAMNKRMTGPVKQEAGGNEVFYLGCCPGFGANWMNLQHFHDEDNE